MVWCAKGISWLRHEVNLTRAGPDCRMCRSTRLDPLPVLNCTAIEAALTLFRTLDQVEAVLRGDEGSLV